MGDCTKSQTLRVSPAEPGDFLLIIKAGKSAVVSAGIASTFARPNTDCLGWRSDGNPRGAALLHFDTEQSRGDHHNLVMRALQRDGRTRPPERLQSYCLTGFGYAEMRLVSRSMGGSFHLAGRQRRSRRIPQRRGGSLRSCPVAPRASYRICASDHWGSAPKSWRRRKESWPSWQRTEPQGRNCLEGNQRRRRSFQDRNEMVAACPHPSQGCTVFLLVQ